MGKSFQSTVALALAHIANAAVEHRGTTPKTHLNLGADQSIAWLWLMPRLAGFREAYPEINVRLVASDNKSDCLASEIDIAIAFGPDDWPGFTSEELFGEEIFPVCSPTYLQTRKIESSEDLLRCTLLELEDDTWGWVNWRMWLTSQGVHSPVKTRVHPDQQLSHGAAKCTQQHGHRARLASSGRRHGPGERTGRSRAVSHAHRQRVLPAHPGSGPRFSRCTGFQAVGNWKNRATHGGSKPDR